MSEELVAELTTRTDAWLGLGDAPNTDSAALAEVAPAVVELVTNSRARRDNTTGAWTPETWTGAVMLAARLVRRRNSPAGIEAFTADGVAYVRRHDPDVVSMLRLNAPAIG